MRRKRPEWKVIMTYEEASEKASRDESFKATVYAMNSLLLLKGAYSPEEFRQLFVEWVEKEGKKSADKFIGVGQEETEALIEIAVWCERAADGRCCARCDESWRNRASLLRKLAAKPPTSATAQANDAPCPENERCATTPEESGIRSGGNLATADLRKAIIAKRDKAEEDHKAATASNRPFAAAIDLGCLNACNEILKLVALAQADRSK